MMKPKIAVVVNWVAGVLSVIVSYLGLMSFVFTPPWGSTMTPMQMVTGFLLGVTMLVAFPLYLLFRWRPGLAILLQWSAVVLSIASADAQNWIRTSGILANLAASFSPEGAVFVYPLLPAVLLTILNWLKKNPEVTRPKGFNPD